MKYARLLITTYILFFTSNLANGKEDDQSTPVFCGKNFCVSSALRWQVHSSQREFNTYNFSFTKDEKRVFQFSISEGDMSRLYWDVAHTERFANGKRIKHEIVDCKFENYALRKSKYNFLIWKEDEDSILFTVPSSSLIEDETLSSVGIHVQILNNFVDDFVC